MKKIIAGILAILISLSLTGCSEISELTDLLNGDKVSELVDGLNKIEDMMESLEQLETLEDLMGDLVSGLESAGIGDIIGGEEYQGSLSFTEMYEIWEDLGGYWNAAEGYYVMFELADSTTGFFEKGQWGAGGGSVRSGLVDELKEVGAGILQATVTYVAKEETDMDPALPAQTVIILIDYSGKEQDGKIRVQVDGEYRQYAPAGATSDQAYDDYLDNNSGDIQITGSTEAEQIASLWKLLEGCHCSAEDRFVWFTYRDGKPVFQYGTKEVAVNAMRGSAYIKSMTNFNGVSFVITMEYPAVPLGTTDQDRSPLNEMIVVGIGELGNTGKISVETTEYGHVEYEFCAETYEEFLQKHK